MSKNLAVVVVVALIGCGGSVEKPAAVAPPVAAPVAAKSQEVVEVVTPPVAVVPVVAVPEPTPTPAAIPPAAEPEQPKESRKATAFKEKVANYLEEARAGAKLMTIGATLAEMTEKKKQITDLYTHLPDPPKELDPDSEVALRLKRINGQFAVAVEYGKLVIKAQGLGSAELVKKSLAQLDKTAAETKVFADEIEALLSK